MKGNIQAISLYILTLGISLGLMSAIHYDATRYLSQRVLKQGLSETMLSLAELPPRMRLESLPGLLESSIRLRKPDTLWYRLSVLGFMEEPLALRVRLVAGYPSSPDDNLFTLEETMIEVNP